MWSVGGLEEEGIELFLEKWSLKVGAWCPHEMLVAVYQLPQHCILEDTNLLKDCCVSRKCHMTWCSLYHTDWRYVQVDCNCDGVTLCFVEQKFRVWFVTTVNPQFYSHAFYILHFTWFYTFCTVPGQMRKLLPGIVLNSHNDGVAYTQWAITSILSDKV
jgi:hypothetical protein